MKNKITSFVTIAILVLSLLCSSQTKAQVTLYGLTSHGGTNNVGTVFSITPSGNFTIIANLDATYAAEPEGSLLYASDGNFYASSLYGGYMDSCTIFNCSPSGVITTIINLDTVWGYCAPEGNSLIQALDGNLYGMTTEGGASTSSYGIIFKLELSGYYTALHYFKDTDGAFPYGSLIQTPDSTFWGMTNTGGEHDSGTIFKFTPSGEFHSVYSFSRMDGTNPYGDLLFANDGNFYGLTFEGGRYNLGTLFRYSPSGVFTKLVDFHDTNGGFPTGSLIQASDGNLYGMTSYGGSSNHGILFMCTTSGNLTTLIDFNDTSNGGSPAGSLMQASDGNYYGMTYGGGQHNLGTIFQYSSSHILTKLIDLDSSTGYSPMYGKMTEVDNISAETNKLAKDNEQVKIYPNPNDGEFIVTCHSERSEESLPILKIYNALGQKVLIETLHSAQGDNAIDLSSQPNGIYLYRIMDEKGNNISNGKFIIQK